jgi:hypothetical protein
MPLSIQGGSFTGQPIFTFPSSISGYPGKMGDIQHIVMTKNFFGFFPIVKVEKRAGSVINSRPFIFTTTIS